MCLRGTMKRHLPYALVFIVVMVLAGPTEALTQSPPDISGHWAESDIEGWLERGWISGYEGGTFRPDHSVTRAEFIVFVDRAYEVPESGEVPGFDDVARDDWFFDAVANAVSAGIITGRDEATFAPQAPITRQEAAVILNRLLNLGTVEDASRFPDQADIAPWAEAAVNAVAGAEIVTGYPEDGTFRPLRPITRAETVVILNRGLDFALDEAVLLPEAIRKWVDYSRDILVAQAREYEGTLYLLVTYGEQLTSGYGVEITEIVEEPDRLVVNVAFEEPEEDEPVLQVLTYPYDLETVEPTDRPVEFEAEGAMEVVPEIDGLDWLPPMVAGEEDIRILSPAPGGPVQDNLTIEGIENVFEGTVHYRLLDADGQEIESGITVGHAYDWGHFEIDFDLTKAATVGEMVTVEVYSECPIYGDEINKVTLDFMVMAAARLISPEVDLFFCEREVSFGFEVTLDGALATSDAIRVNFTEPAENGLYFTGDLDDIDVSPAGTLQTEETVPPGLPILIYQPDEELPDETAITFEVDPGNATPPGYHLGCENDEVREMEHEVIFERTDSGHTATYPMSVAGPISGSFLVMNQAEEPLEDATVLVDGQEGTSDEAGRVSFDLTPRTYDYLVEKSGYVSVHGGLDIETEPWEEPVILKEETLDGRLALDNETYEREEEVEITVLNLGEDDLFLGMNTFPFLIQRYEDGEWIDVEIEVEMLWVEVILEPEETHIATFKPSEDFVSDPEIGTYRVVNEAEWMETGETLILGEKFEIVPTSGEPSAADSEIEPAMLELMTDERDSFYVTVNDAYGDPVPLGTDEDETSVSLKAPDGSNPVAYYDWLTVYSNYYNYGDDNQIRIEIKAHESNTGSADDLHIWADDVLLTDRLMMLVSE